MANFGCCELIVFMFVHYCVIISSVANPLKQQQQQQQQRGLQAFALNEYEYSRQRDDFLAAQDAFEGHDISTLNEDELIVNAYLHYLKWRDFQATRETGFPPSRPIEEQLDYIRGTEIYAALKKLPKGGSMHSHENHELSKRALLEIIYASPEFQYLYILPDNHPTDPWKLDFFINPPTDTPAWIKVQDSGYTMDDILAHQTLLAIMTDEASRYPTDSEERWRQMNQLWNRGSTQLIANYNIKTKYLEAIYSHGFDEGVIYFELKKNFGSYERIYVLDPSGASSATNGKLYLDENGDMDVEVAVEAAANFSLLHPEFVGHRRSSYTHRMGAVDGAFKDEMDNVQRLNAKYPDHVIGFDTVGQEDAGNSLLYYLERFLTTGPSLPLWLHAAETSWPDDLISSSQDYDPVSTPQNAVDALLLLPKRVGHATGFYKHPYRVEMLRQQGIAVETCPVSNQLLGYVPDMRQHPALIYHRSGIPLVLGPDDPGTMGYDDFTVDWYEIYMAWGLDLSDLKKLALNSLQYSSMSEVDKQQAIETKWTPMWNQYIDEMKDEACARDFAGEAAGPPSFGRLLPREGANAGSTPVHVYGRNLEPAICSAPRCRFGTAGESPHVAVYVDNGHLLCDAPPPPPGTDQLSVGVEVALDGVNYVDTGLTFTYKHPPQVRRLPRMQPSSSSSTNAAASTVASPVGKKTFQLLALLAFCLIVMWY